MSSIKKTLMKQGMKLMSDPRVMKIMQDERVMKAVMQMMNVPGKVQSFTDEQVAKLAKAMSLATEDEVKDLEAAGPPARGGDLAPGEGEEEVDAAQAARFSIQFATSGHVVSGASRPTSRSMWPSGTQR